MTRYCIVQNYPEAPSGLAEALRVAPSQRLVQAGALPALPVKPGHGTDWYLPVRLITEAVARRALRRHFGLRRPDLLGEEGRLATEYATEDVPQAVTDEIARWQRFLRRPK